MNEFNYDNEIIEISSDNNEVEELYEESISKNNNKKSQKSLKEKWNDLSKGTKTGIVVGVVILLLLIFGIIIYQVFFNNSDKENKLKEEPVILEKDNYRYEDGVLVFLDKSDKSIGTYECVDKDTEKCFVAKLDYSKDSFERITSVYESGEEIIKNANIYFNNIVFVYDEGKISLYNIDTKEKDLELKSIKTYDTEENLVVIEDEDNKFGIIKITEEGYDYLFRCSFDNVGIINTKLVYSAVQDKDKHYIVDRDGRRISKNFNNTIMSASKDYVVVKNDAEYSLYDYENRELLSDYDYIKEIDGIITLVKENRLYLRDSALNKLHEDGIRLENSNYVKKYVYDKNNRLIETKKSYEIELDKNNVFVTIGEDTKEINTLNGLISSKLNYISYYGDKLYFYGDEEKTEVLGTYTCTNKNSIESEEDTLNKCYIYENELGISGIYNNEYVFIYDNESNEDIKYYLYSLKENKAKGTYSSLEIIDKSELNTQSKLINTQSSYIIAKSATGNNKGNLGVLEINSEKVQGKVNFSYKSVVKEGDYYLLQNINNNYSIYNNEFTKISNDFSYVKLYENYYIGISNNKLNVYSYDRTLGILEKDIEINDTSYDITFDNGFVITVGTNTYKFDNSGNEIKDEPSTEEVIEPELNGEENGE